MRSLFLFTLALMATTAMASTFCEPFDPSCAPAGTFSGPVSKYYLDDQISGRIYVVQGTNVVESFPVAYSNGYSEGVLAVSETIRTRWTSLLPYPPWEGYPAGEYTLSGDPTGHSYFVPRVPFRFYAVVYDGTSDGTYNYYVDHNAEYNQSGGGVYRTDYYWQDPQFLFYPKFLCLDFDEWGCTGVSGIAYDPTNNSLWISSRKVPWIADYSMDGTLLAEFETEYGNMALGLDSADHTLWASIWGTNLLAQYSLDGATFGEILQAGTPSGLPDYDFTFTDDYFPFMSGDFKTVPEPSTILLFATAFCLFGIRKICG